MKKRGIRLLKISLIVGLTAVSLTGCKEENKVDYTIDGIMETEQAKSEGCKSDLAQFSGEEVWKETWMSKAYEPEGETYVELAEVNVNAKITVPQTEHMSVVEVAEPEFDADFRETVAKNLFDSYEIFKEDDKDTDTDTELKDYTLEEYIGTYEEQTYLLTFSERTGDNETYFRRFKQISLEVKDLYEVCPQKLSEVEDLTYSTWTDGDWVENQCEISKEDARIKAEDFLERLGLDYPVLSHSLPLLWGTPPQHVTEESVTEDWEVNGYVFFFDLGVDDISFVNFGVEDDYANFEFDAIKYINEGIRYSLNARVEIYVTDKGVIKMVANNPMELVGISEGVELLPLETIKNIMKEEMYEQVELFRFIDHEKYYDAMELIYFRVRDDENPEKYSYVPVWRLAAVTRNPLTSEISIREAVMINAIDGSVIDFYDET